MKTSLAASNVTNGSGKGAAFGVVVDEVSDRLAVRDPPFGTDTEPLFPL
jgi:hypothetical protein